MKMRSLRDSFPCHWTHHAAIFPYFRFSLRPRFRYWACMCGKQSCSTFGATLTRAIDSEGNARWV